ncbi:MAG TPA: molybdenum cofactor guanylyltransferase [Polyangiaceae bacterium]|nr:molybdenum cofactor guanylyltransferase [Polyangiaceae bacterium]
MGTLVGIFVGGKSTRMQGHPKGLLVAPLSSLTLVERLAALAARTLPRARVVLVGEHPAYAGVALAQLADVPSGEAGPLAGLAALCLEATRIASREVLCLACDLPYVEAQLLERLAHHAPDQPAVAARVDGRWQPFFARYRVDAASPVIAARLASRRLGLYGVLDELAAAELPLHEDEARQLRDWDTPEDMSAD